MLMSAERSALVVVDVQERLMPAVETPERVLRNLGILLRAAAELSVPVLASEQYPRGLGRTLPDIAALLPKGGSPIEKTAFGCLDEPVFAERFEALGRDQVVLTGVEAHVCVLQTAFALREAVKAVFVVADAVSSRVALSAERAFDRLRGAGVDIVTTEMVVFEWLKRAGSPAFKTLSGLVK